MRLNLQPVRAVVLLAALAILIVTLATTFLLWESRERELAHARMERKAIMAILEKQTRQSLEGISLVLKVLQDRLQNSYGARLELDGLAVRLLLSARGLVAEPTSSMFIVDHTGTIINTSLPGPVQHLDVSDRDYFRAFVTDNRDDVFVSRPVRNRLDHQWTLYFARRLNRADGSFRGVLVAAVPPSRFEQQFETVRLDIDRAMSLHMTDGTLIASLPHREDAIGQIAPAPAHGVVRGNVAGFPIYLTVADDEGAALAAWRDIARPIAIGAALILLLVVVIAWWYARELAHAALLQRALSEAHDRFERTIESVMDAIVAIDAQQNIVIFNRAAEHMFGLPAAAALGRPLANLLPERFRRVHVQHLQRFMAAQVRSRSTAEGRDIIGLRHDGTEFPIESTIAQTVIGGHPQLTAVLRDVTERRRAERRLHELNQQLRQLSASLLDVRELERRRISRELHDELGQQLTGLKLDLSWLAGRIREGRAVPIDKIDAMRRLLDATITAVRRISSDLRPSMLDDLGFGDAVSWQANQFSQRSGVRVVLALDAVDLIKDDAVATALYRIVQESLTNVARHAQATRVDLSLRADAAAILLAIRDDGQGMDTGARRAGLGLVGIRERAMALGGTLEIRSDADKGTTIEVRIPLPAAPAPVAAMASRLMPSTLQEN
ncbi:MAG: PAS domain S-box protein [Leptothrix sp. (in: b-proteobacteria)]